MYYNYFVSKNILKNVIHITLVTLINIIGLYMFYVENYKVVYCMAITVIIFLVFIFIRRHFTFRKLRVDKKKLEESKAQALEYIDALWIGQHELIQSEKISSIDTLISGIAHELNTPLGISLTGITYVKEIMSGEKAKAIAHDSLPMVDMTINNINKSITLIKYFSEIADTEPHNDVRELNLKSMVEFSITSIAPKKTLGRDIEFVYNIPENLNIKASPQSFSIIFMNIIENIFDFAFEFSEHGEVHISAKVSGKDLKVTIEDNGKGISPENITRISDPFFSTRKRNDHYGLGLTVSYSLIQRHYKGDISVSAKLDKGTVFKLRFPGIISI